MAKFPRLKTLYQGPLRPFELEILQQSLEIEAWFQTRWQEVPALLTTSVDLRVSADKIAPIDTNIFPAGFNNLTEEMKLFCINAIRSTMSQKAPKATSVLILTENHTRNLFYIESLQVLSSCFTAAGFTVELRSLAQFEKERVAFDVIVLNHDLSDGLPQCLQDLAHLVHPSPYLGWWNRSKTQHFTAYEAMVSDFCQRFSLDKDTFFTPFRTVQPIDFMQKTGFDRLAEAVSELKTNHAPFITIKADKGTYGMGVMMVNSVEEVFSMNRRQRSHMAARKGGEKVMSVLVQEGVETIEQSETHHAEPVIYLIGSTIVGGFYRLHPAQSASTSLNSPGMYFKPCEVEVPVEDDYLRPQAAMKTNRFYVYGVIARLAALAAAHESILSQSQNDI